MTNLMMPRRFTPRILCPELVGREAESLALDEALAAAAANVTKTVLVAGDAGVGKTALVRHFVERARGTGARVLTGECVQAEARRPFSAFVDLMRSAEKEISATAVEQSMRRNAVELFRLLPERATSAQGSLGERGTRERIHESFAALLGDLARRRTLVVVIEDLHWADEASLELFPMLARRLRSHRVLLVATYRTDELHRRHPLRPVVAELVRARLAHTVTLGPLTPEGSAAVIRAALSWDGPPAEFREAIHDRCEGNPFFIEEVLQALAERGALVHTDGAWHLAGGGGTTPAIPGTIHSAVQDRVALLESDARRVLEVAAVVGQRFEFALLAAVTRAREPDIMRALRAAMEAQLVVEGDGADTYAFRHALTRESVVTELLERERRVLHLAVGEAIESIASAHLVERVEELAYHFDEAHDNARALRYRDLAAREAARLGAYSRAMHHLERALVLAPADSAALASLQLRLADAAMHASDHAREGRASLAALELSRALGDQPGVGHALLLLAGHRKRTGDVAAGVELHREAVRILEPLGDSEALAQAYTETAMDANVGPQTVDREVAAERAVALARRMRSRVALSWALQSLGLARHLDGRPNAIEALREGLHLALENDVADTAQRGYLNLRAVLFGAGAPLAEREAVWADCEAHARRFGVRTPLFVYQATWYALGRGDWERAQALSAEQAGSGSRFASTASLCGAFIDLARGGPSRALAAVEAAGLCITQSVDPMVAQSGHHVILLYLLAGEPGKALLFADGLPDAVFGRDLVSLCALLAAIAAADEVAIDRWTTRPLTQIGWARSPTATARQQIAQAERDLRDENLDHAVDRLGQATRTLADGEDRFIETLVRLRRADVLLRRGGPSDADAAAVELAAVIPFWRRVRATWYLGQLRTWAKQRGVPFPHARGADRAQRAAGATPELTAREREVAALVGQGLTNREIAAQLVISERTAEGHIEQIRNKLGVRSRSLVAVWAAADRN